MRSPLLSAMRFVGHRGASHVAPENTIAAFRAAAARGVGFECDLQALRDGTLLVLHDDTLLRTATAPPGLSDAASRRWADLVRTPVGELDYDDVRDVDVGSWMSTNFASERPPRFDEALLVKAPDVFAELKCDDDGYGFDGRLPDLVGALALPSSLTWISFSLPLAGRGADTAVFLLSSPLRRRSPRRSRSSSGATVHNRACTSSSRGTRKTPGPRRAPSSIVTWTASTCPLLQNWSRPSS